MKRLIPLLLTAVGLFGHAPKAHAYSVVNTCTVNRDGSGANNCTISSVTAKDWIVSFVWSENNTCPDYDWHDSIGTTYTMESLQCSGTGEFINAFALEQGQALTSGSYTFTMNNPQFAFAFALVMEISGIGSFDTSNGSNALTGTTLSTGSITTAQSGEYLIAGAMSVATATPLTAGSGYTIRVHLEASASGHVAMAAADDTAGSAGSYSTSFTASASGQWQAVIGAFKPAAAKPRHHATTY